MKVALTVLWIGLTALFVIDAIAGSHALGELPRTPYVDSADIDPLALRATLSDPPRVEIGGYQQKCSDCHALFASLDVTPGDLRQHGHIALNHGINDRCYNCHAQEDRNLLVLRDGGRVGFSESQALCAQCHGTLYRDWERGMHGRTTGSWDPESSEHGRLRCVDCHDPHAPAFGPITLLPGPRPRGWRPPTTTHNEHALTPSERNPLERWKHLPSSRGSRKHHE